MEWDSGRQTQLYGQSHHKKDVIELGKEGKRAAKMVRGFLGQRFSASVLWHTVMLQMVCRCATKVCVWGGIYV